MTDYEREYSYRVVKEQLEYGCLDISVTHNKNEIEIVKREMTALRICEQYKRELGVITTRFEDSGIITKEDLEKLLECNKRYEELCYMK